MKPSARQPDGNSADRPRTGAELREHRRAAGLSQGELAERAGFTRDTVRYWEAKAEVNLRQAAPRRFLEALGLGGLNDTDARAGMGPYSNPDLCRG